MRQLYVALLMTFGLPAFAAEPEAPPPVPPQETAQSSTPEDPAGALMEKARQAFTAGDFPRAIQLFTKLLENPDERHRQDALEMLGVARERNGQLAQAKAVYDKYLTLYTQGEAVERVKQRIAGLVTADWKPKEKLAEQPMKHAVEGWRLNGMFNQYVSYFTSQISGQSTKSETGTLVTALDLNTRGKLGALDIRARANGSYLNDLINHKPSDTFLNFLYVDVSSGDFSSRLGRQTQYDGGVLGRFDGLSARLRLGPQYTLRLASGYPVDRTRDVRADTSRVFYSLGLDSKPTGSAWSYNGYVIDQYANGLSDRRAVGLESRYFKDDRNLVNLIDYDVGFNRLNILMLQGTLPIAEQTLFNYALDYRAAPLVSTRNALIGQTVTDLQSLQSLYTVQEIRNLARDRSANSQMALLGLSRQFSTRYRLDTDLSLSNMTATPASGGAMETPGTGNEYFLSGRLTINNLLNRQDVSFVGLRLGKLYNADSIAFNANARIARPSGWRYSPGLRIEERHYTQQDTRQLQILPSLRIDYQWGQRYFFEFEGGYDWTRLNTWYGTQETRAVFGRLGYRIDF